MATGLSLAWWLTAKSETYFSVISFVQVLVGIDSDLFFGGSDRLLQRLTWNEEQLKSEIWKNKQQQRPSSTNALHETSWGLKADCHFSVIRDILSHWTKCDCYLWNKVVIFQTLVLRFQNKMTLFIDSLKCKKSTTPIIVIHISPWTKDTTVFLWRPVHELRDKKNSWLRSDASSVSSIHKAFHRNVASTKTYCP